MFAELCLLAYSIFSNTYLFLNLFFILKIHLSFLFYFSQGITNDVSSLLNSFWISFILNDFSSSFSCNLEPHSDSDFLFGVLYPFLIIQLTLK